MTSIAFQLEDLQQEIAKTCAKRQIFKHNVRLIAVSKRHSGEKIRQAYQAGQKAFAENFVQEGIEKIQQLSDLDVEWHMIGAIQSRKCKDIAEHFDWVQSVDRLKVAQKLSQARTPERPPLQLCIQVNLFNEQQKAGLEAKAALQLAEQIQALPNVQLRGIMALPPKQTAPQAQKQQFAEIYALYQQLAARYPNIDTCSMGMSGDYQAAIEQGSSMIRVGTTIFGARD
ncbi:MAG: YggS family pyridoxal phosphate-dependent enzyme [Kangiellaceae bacterium]|nr:YggS family pyridoxal phosphate-dependent enzyme [Kangiellaceae bacterium]